MFDTQGGVTCGKVYQTNYKIKKGEKYTVEVDFKQKFIALKVSEFVVDILLY